MQAEQYAARSAKLAIDLGRGLLKAIGAGAGAELGRQGIIKLLNSTQF